MLTKFVHKQILIVYLLKIILKPREVNFSEIL